MRNICMLTDYFHIPTYNLINGKSLRVPIIHFYILQFNIQRHFHAILFVRVSYSVQTVKCARKMVQTIPVTTYKNTYQHDPHAIIHFYILIQLNIWWHFCAILSPAPEIILRDKTITIYKTTPMHSSRAIFHLYIRKHFFTRLIWF